MSKQVRDVDTHFSFVQELYKGMFIYWKIGVPSYGFYGYYIR